MGSRHDRFLPLNRHVSWGRAHRAVFCSRWQMKRASRSTSPISWATVRSGTARQNQAYLMAAYGASASFAHEQNGSKVSQSRPRAAPRASPCVTQLAAYVEGLDMVHVPEPRPRTT